MLRRLLAAFTLAAALVAPACGGTTPTTPTNPAPGSSTANVTISVTGDGVAVAGAKVALGSFASAETNDAGQVRFNAVPYGTYTASVSGAFGFASGQTSVDARTETVNASVSLAASNDVVMDHIDCNSEELRSGDTIRYPCRLTISGRYRVINRTSGAYQVNAETTIDGISGAVPPKVSSGPAPVFTETTWLLVRNVVGPPSMSVNGAPSTVYEKTDGMQLSVIPVPSNGSFVIAPRKIVFVLHYAAR